jgi:TolB-like protein/Flp pilus assembly protein TadD
VEVASLEKMAFPLPDKPSIAVLPMINRSGDPEQEYFADGITDDLITDLSKLPGLFVIASNSTFTYKGKPVKIRQVAEELGVRYVLEGGVSKAGERVKINAQLIDATTGRHLWAERYDGKLSDIVTLHDRVTREIVAALALRLTSAEQVQIGRRATNNIEAYDAYLQGLEHKRRNTRKDTAKAVFYLEKAVDLDPNFTQAYALLAGCYARSMFRGWDLYLGWSNARFLAQKNLQLAMRHPTPIAYRVAAGLQMQQLRYDEAIIQAERAIALNPNDANSHFWMGRVLICSGRSDEALEFLKRATRLNPHSPAGYLWNFGLAQFCLGHYEEAVNSLESAQRRNPRIAPWLLAATYGHLGREQQAADVLAEYIKRRGFKRTTVAWVVKNYPWIRIMKLASDRDRFAKGLHKAGMPLK